SFEEKVVRATEWTKTIQHIVSVGTNSSFTKVEYEQWIGEQPSVEPTRDVPLRETATICYLYTGGTDASPKDAMRSDSSSYLVGGPLFVASSLAITIPNFFVGNPVNLLERFDQEAVLRGMDEEKTTTTFLAPPMLDAIFSLPEEIKEKYDVSSMESIISVGAP